jgi:cold shock CspA family protein
MDQNEQQRTTRTAQTLLSEVTYPVMMHEEINNRSRRDDPLVKGLFMPHKDLKDAAAAATAIPPTSAAARASVPPGADYHDGVIHSLKGGFGFIRPSNAGKDVFFYYAAVTNADFNDLKPGEKVRYRHGKNDKGLCAVDVEPL